MQTVKEILWPAWIESHHFTTNNHIWFDDDDHARAFCDVDCIGTTSDGLAQTVAATYRDQFERRNGMWKIAWRAVEIQHFKPIPGLVLCRPGQGG